MARGLAETRERQSVAQAVGVYLRTFAGLKPNARRLLLATLCINTGVGVFGVLFNLYLVALSYSLVFVGLVAAVSTVGQAGVAPFMGWTLRRYGARAVMAAGAAAMALTLGVAAVVTAGAALAAASALAGAAFSVATIPAAPYMMEHATAQERSHLFSAYFAAGTIGSMVGSLLSGAVPALAATLLGAHGQQVMADRLGLLSGAVVTGLGTWLFWSMRAEVPAADSADRPVAFAEDDGGEARTRGDVLVMLAATGAIALTMGATMPFFNVYFAARLHASTATIGGIYAASGVVCTLAAFLAPAAARRGRLPAFSMARLLTAPIFLFFWLHPVLALAATAYIARNALGTVSGALENTFAMEVLPARLRGIVASWRSFAFNAAWSLGSFVAGFVVAHYGYDVLFIVGAALTAGGAAGYFTRFARRYPISK